MRVGTASVRRRAQLLALEPSLSIEPLRGNIDTRLRKRGERGLDAVVLAACGLDRLGLGRRDRAAVRAGGGASGGGPGRARAAGARRARRSSWRRADHAETRRRVEAERAVVFAIGGGCLAPVAAHHDGSVLTAMVAAEDGRWLERRRATTRPRSPPSSAALAEK